MKDNAGVCSVSEYKVIHITIYNGYYISEGLRIRVILFNPNDKYI